MSPDSLSHWLALHLMQGLGCARLHRLLAEFGCASSVLQAPRPMLREFGLTKSQLENLDSVLAGDGSNSLVTAIQRSLDWAQQPGCALLCLADEDYPSLLRCIADPPAVLFVQGCRDVLACPQVAVVGSRNPSAGGLDNARAFAGGLVRAGLAVTSGLALGIDAGAHAAAVAEAGYTLAVLGTGLDQIYPPRNRSLAMKVAEQGLLVSEFALGTLPKAANFPRRNRIISGLAMGTLVVEASVRSGSLITARLALEQGREVYAIPGSIHNPQARGCHQLIKQGAKLVETVEDILEELPALVAHYQDLAMHWNTPLQSAFGTVPSAMQSEVSPLSQDAQRVLEALGFDPAPIDLLVNRTGLPSHVVSAELMTLELAGRVVNGRGGFQRC